MWEQASPKGESMIPLGCPFLYFLFPRGSVLYKIGLVPTPVRKENAHWCMLKASQETEHVWAPAK